MIKLFKRHIYGGFHESLQQQKLPITWFSMAIDDDVGTYLKSRNILFLVFCKKHTIIYLL